MDTKHDTKSLTTTTTTATAATAVAKEKPPPSYMIYLALFVVHVLFVLWFFVAKYAMAEVDLPPIVFAAYREAVATAVFLGMMRYSHSSSGGASGSASFTTTILNVYRQHARLFQLMGFLMFTNVAGFIIGLSMVTSFNAAILQPTQPIFASLIAWMFRYETMSRLKVLSIATACSGAILTVYLSSLPSLHVDQEETGTIAEEGVDNNAAAGVAANAEEDGLNPRLGNTILLFQCMGCGAMIVLQKRVLMEVPSPLIVTAITYTIASCLTCLAAILSRGIQDPLLYVTSTIAWSAIVYAALFATVFTYYTLAWANNWANPSTVALSLCLQPLLTALFTAISGGPKLVPPQALSCGLILAGLCIRVYDTEQGPPPPKSIEGDNNNDVDDDNDIELPIREVKPLIQRSPSGSLPAP